MKETKSFFYNLQSVFSLFGSFSTLICCALPIALTVLGLSSILFGLLTNFPFLKTLVLYKHYLFIFTFCILSINFWILYKKSPPEECEAPPKNSPPNSQETACETGNRWNKIILWISTVIFIIGLFTTYLLLPIVQLIEK